MIFRANIQPSCRCGSGKRAAFSKAAGRLLHRPCWVRERSINLPVYPPWRTTTPLSRAALDASDLRIRRVAAQHPVESHGQSSRCRHFGHSFGFARRNSGDDDDCGVGLPKEHHGSEIGGQTRSCRYAMRSMAMNFSDGHKYDFLRRDGLEVLVACAHIFVHHRALPSATDDTWCGITIVGVTPKNTR